MIPCKLKGIRSIGKNKVKYGRFMTSFFPVKGYGTNRWVVGVNLELNYNKYVKKGLTNEEIVNQCVQFLNQPPPRKKKVGRPPKKPKYVIFDETPYRFYIKQDKQNKTYIQALLVTAEKKSRHFWGSGKKHFFRKRKRKNS